MKNIFSRLTILAIVTVTGGITAIVNTQVNAQESQQPIVRGGAKYFQNLGVNNVNKTSVQGAVQEQNEIRKIRPFTIDNNPTDIPAFLEGNNTQSEIDTQLSGTNANGTPMYTYSQGVLVLPLAERQEAIPYNRPGDASLQLTKLRFGENAK